MYAWADEEPDGNIAVRLGDTVIGIDVDDYDGKGGGKTLAEAQRRWGALPPSPPRSSSSSTPTLPHESGSRATSCRGRSDTRRRRSRRYSRRLPVSVGSSPAAAGSSPTAAVGGDGLVVAGHQLRDLPVRRAGVGFNGAQDLPRPALRGGQR
jgi:hypothetical protein